MAFDRSPSLSLFRLRPFCVIGRSIRPADMPLTSTSPRSSQNSVLPYLTRGAL